MLGRDGVESLAGELTDLGEVLACGCQSTRDLRRLGGLGGVRGLMALAIGLVLVLAERSVPDSAEEARNSVPVCAARLLVGGWLLEFASC